MSEELSGQMEIEEEPQHPRFADSNAMLPEEPGEDETETAGTYDDDIEEEESHRFLPAILQTLLYILVVIGISFGLSWYGWKFMVDVFALSKPDEEVQVIIYEGETMDQVVADLCEKEIIQYDWLFKLFCSFTHAENKISTGSYTLNRMYDYHAIVNGLRATSENRAIVSVAIPSGYTCCEIFQLLEEKNVCTVEELEKACANFDFHYDCVKDLPFGNPYRLEGYLYPDTYLFYVNDTPERVIAKFLANFESKFDEKLRAEIDSINEMLRIKMVSNGYTEEEIEAAKLDVHRFITVASMLEKETGSVSESSTIASVIYNRLSSKTFPFLQVDATIRYALNRWTGNLTDEDRCYDSPYNTFRRAGLPAGPISNPGIDSIRAALYPRDTTYYFYTLNPENGLHHFSENYYEHESYLASIQTDDEEIPNEKSEDPAANE